MQKPSQGLALILDKGALTGAFGAGVAAELCRRLGHRYFRTIRGLSVGSMTGTFLAANQPEVIDEMWRNHISAEKLLKWRRLLPSITRIHDQTVLDLENVIGKFSSGPMRLDCDAVEASGVDLRFSIMDYHSGEHAYVPPDRRNIFDLMEAACSLPIVRGPKKIGDRYLLDGAFVHGGIPDLQDIIDAHDHTVAVLNHPMDERHSRIYEFFLRHVFPIAAYGYPRRLRAVFRRKMQNRAEISACEQRNRGRFTILAPKERLFHSPLHGTRQEINAAVDQGMTDARKFLEQMGNVPASPGHPSSLS